MIDQAAIIQVFSGVILASLAFYAVKRAGVIRLPIFFAASLAAAALIYAAFALIACGLAAGRPQWIGFELIGVAAYSAIAIAGIRVSTSLLAAGWALHTIWDSGVLHGGEIVYVPGFYRNLCLGFDLAIAGFISYRIYHRRLVY